MHARDRYVRHVWGCVGALLLAGVAGAATPVAPAEPLTAAAAIETTRFMIDAIGRTVRNPQGAVSLSPDGRTYVARLVRGDVRRNGVWMELIAGDASTPAAAARYRVLARLFSSGLGAGYGQRGSDQDTNAELSPIHWIGGDSVAFLWSDGRGVRQVMRVNVRTGEQKQLTKHDTNVVSFAIGANGTLLYCAHVPVSKPAPEQALAKGFVIEPETDAPSLLLGRINEGSMVDRLWNTQWFVRTPIETVPRLVRLGDGDSVLDPMQTAAVSPDGRWAILNSNAKEISPEWDAYEERSFASWVREARGDPRTMMARLVHRLWVLDVNNGTVRPLWDAPIPNAEAHFSWSPDGTAIAIAPTFLPPASEDQIGLHGTAAAIVDAHHGTHVVLPVDLEAKRVVGVRWLASSKIEVRIVRDGKVMPLRFAKVAGRWRADNASRESQSTAVRFELRQDLNTPPSLVAVDPESKQEKLILDPNPGLLQRYALGTVKRIDGRLDSGEAWRGLLFYPPDYREGVRYPLVIQSTYAARFNDEFTLYGNQRGYGLGPTLMAPYPGRVLSGRGVLVLQLEVDDAAVQRKILESELRWRAFEGAARKLIEEGLVDPERVGIAGFSRNGYYVEYALTHSSFPYAAALAADNWDPSYVAQTLLDYANGGIDMHGAAPFGTGLQAWIDKAPGFGADRVRTPLLKIEQSHALLGVLVKWEIFARLRYLKKPVEYYVLPNARYGVHNTQNPAQIIAVMERTADWFAFWLTGSQDPASHKQAQYERWRQLRALHVTGAAEPVPSNIGGSETAE